MQAVLLAAGESSRFWPLCEGYHKSLFRLMGKPLIQWTLEALERAGVKEAIIVQAPTRAVERALKDVELKLKVRYVVQERPKVDFRLVTLHGLRVNYFRLVAILAFLAVIHDADGLLRRRYCHRPWA